MRKEAALALGRVQSELQPQGLGLLVYDAYRPIRATKAMMAWARRAGKWNLIKQGYIATRSRHNHGIAVDLTLVSLDTGIPLDMGTPWDAFHERSHTRNASGSILKSRLKLERIMKKHGFRPYKKEWWHFNFSIKKTKPRDVPYACFEPEEGAWLAPKNWEDSTYKAEKNWKPHPCK